MSKGYILHCAGVRMAVSGEQNLVTRLRSFDEVKTSNLRQVILTVTGDRLVSLLANFSDQRIQVEVGTEDYAANLNLSQIIVYIKEKSTGYPQV